MRAKTDANRRLTQLTHYLLIERQARPMAGKAWVSSVSLYLIIDVNEQFLILIRSISLQSDLFINEPLLVGRSFDLITTWLGGACLSFNK